MTNMVRVSIAAKNGKGRNSNQRREAVKSPVEDHLSLIIGCHTTNSNRVEWGKVKVNAMQDFCFWSMISGPAAASQLSLPLINFPCAIAIVFFVAVKRR